MGKNIFLTGAAGSGKTYLLNQYIAYLKEQQVRVAVTASTGIAATHLQGQTLHSWSGIGVRDSITASDLEKLFSTPRIKRNYKNTSVLIIDEISMLHKHQLDMVDTIARYMLECDEVFGGMQVVVCGDFFQLPPVTTGPLLEPKQFAFEADAWKNGDFHICYLHEQHRQGDDPLLAVLSDIRSGTAGEHTKVPLRTRYKKEPNGNVRPTKLYSRNTNVDAMNEQELALLPGEAKLFTMTSEGWDALVEGLKRNCLAPEQLTLKIGAEVMFVKNDLLGKYVNGTRGVVIGFERNKGTPIVRTYDEETVFVHPEEWTYEDNGIVRATIRQIPLRLAWAITIHKSQGMTLDAAEIDLGDTFEPGMGYVALSRVRSLDGLKLMNLNDMALKVDPYILSRDQEFKEHSAAVTLFLETLSTEEKEARQQETLVKRFGGGSVSSRSAKTPAVPTQYATLALLKEGLSLEAIAEKRSLSLGAILNHIETLKEQDQLDDGAIEHVKQMLPATDFDRIFAEFQNAEDSRLKPIYDRLEGKYPYSSLQLVRLFVDS